FIHGLPMIIGKLATNYVRRIVIVILSISSLVFLGFLDSSDNPNLGTLLKEAIPLLDVNFWALLLPSLVLLLFSLSAQFVANGLHDALDPKVVRGR
ncbi:MAG: ABC transporter permease, partial [Mycoplasmataceae bacterium]|nr:ABC transporter permease [Mycoplasmataceae bacterium]